jgi:hypothetical protein
MPQQQRVGRDESARLFRTSGRVTRSCCPAWCARSLGRERVASTAVLTAGVDDPGITVIIARRALLARPGRTGQAPPDPYRTKGTPPNRGVHAAYRGCPPQLCRGEALPRPPRRWRGTSVPATIPGGLRTPPWAPVRAAGSGPAGPAGQASPPGKSAHLGGVRRRVACRTSVARQMGRHISDHADQCAAQPPHHRLPGPRSRGPHGVGDRAGRKLPGSLPEPASAGCRTAPLGGESASARCAG